MKSQEVKKSLRGFNSFSLLTKNPQRGQIAGIKDITPVW